MAGKIKLRSVALPLEASVPQTEMKTNIFRNPMGMSCLGFDKTHLHMGGYASASAVVVAVPCVKMIDYGKGCPKHAWNVWNAGWVSQISLVVTAELSYPKHPGRLKSFSAAHLQSMSQTLLSVHDRLHASSSLSSPTISCMEKQAPTDTCRR